MKRLAVIVRGAQGAGKSTAARELASYLYALGADVTVSDPPNSGQIGIDDTGLDAAAQVLVAVTRKAGPMAGTEITVSTEQVQPPKAKAKGRPKAKAATFQGEREGFRHGHWRG